MRICTAKTSRFIIFIRYVYTFLDLKQKSIFAQKLFDAYPSVINYLSLNVNYFYFILIES